MNVSIFGLGYVGVVSAAALAEAGHTIVGVDTNLTKVEMITAGRSPIVEPGLDDLLARGRTAGRIRATTDAADAVASTDVSIVCVGTPSATNGSLDLTFVEKVCQDIGLGLAAKSSRHTVIVRSTMLPGSTHDVVIPALEQASGLTAGRDFAVLYNPEFLREGTSLADFADPPFTLVGAEDEEQAAPARELYATLDAPVIVAPIRETEMVKYACNAFHATKITFANEIGNLAASMGVDGRRVMEIVARDTKLNISPAYLRPGFAFGGSCLPKDLRALGHRATRADVPVPLLDSLLRSNAGQVDRALAMIAAAGSTRGSERASTRIGVLGFSFKAGTDDLRESPMVELIERLIGKGYAVRVFDRNVSLAHLQGANRAWIEREIPHIASLMADRIEDVLAASDVVVIGNADPAFAEAVAEMDDGRTVIDLVGIGRTPRLPAGYRGISW